MKNIGIQFERIDIEEDFTVVSNHILRDNTLSWRARGLFIYILSKPETWKVYTNDLIKQATEGRDAMYKAMKELINAGYVRRRQSNKDGVFGNVIYQIWQIPCTDKPYTEKPYTENPSTYKEKIKSNTNLINKKEKSIKEKRKSLQERIEIFKAEVIDTVVWAYPKEMLNEFFSYWSEPNRSGTKMRCELEKTWSLARRLTVWSNRSTVNKTSLDTESDRRELNIHKERERFNKRIEQQKEKTITPEEQKQIADEWKKMKDGLVGGMKVNGQI